MRETYYQLNQKDTIFRRLFMEKKNALDLYNAINKTAHTDVDKLEITTLEKWSGSAAGRADFEIIRCL